MIDGGVNRTGPVRPPATGGIRFGNGSVIRGDGAGTEGRDGAGAVGGVGGGAGRLRCAAADEANNHAPTITSERTAFALMAPPIFILLPLFATTLDS